MLFIVFLLGVQALTYPYGCDCSEHLLEEVCHAHKCRWSNGACSTIPCDKREAENCALASQLHSHHPSYCFLQDNKRCAELKQCENIHHSGKAKEGRDLCLKYRCAYDAVSGYCFSPKECRTLLDQHTCNNALVRDSSNSISSFCYWDEGCQELSKLSGKECSEIENQGACTAIGCDFRENRCQEIECKNRAITECNGEYVNHKGKVFLCFEKNQECHEQSSGNFQEVYCNSMVGHTWNGEKCVKCSIYDQNSK